jgi:membrane peptidoglycan carboxypeptidase
MADPVPPESGAVEPQPEVAGKETRPAGWRPKAPPEWRRRLPLIIGITFALVMVLLLGTFIYAFATLPDPARLDLAGGAVVLFDRHGTLIEERNAQGARVIPVELDQVSPHLKNATIAVEDRHFYEHHGVDWGRVVKAFFIDVVARRPEQGASTITQQLAKVAILQSPKKTALRKLRELMLATALESRYKKDEILKLYLSSIYYGHRATGIEAASQVYFGKHAKELTLAEASMVAGLPRAPSYYDPRLHLERAKQRQAIVLDSMVRQGVVSPSQAEQAKTEKLNFTYKEQRTTQAPHFIDFVFEQLEAQYGPSTVAKGGFTVKTTLDLTLQKAAQHAVETGLASMASRGADNADLIVIDPRSGEILAMVGSADFFNDSIGGQYNVVTAQRQPGSSFKPYVYEEAFRKHKLTMGSALDDTAKNFAGGQFHDFDFRDMGKITAHRALLLSRNIPALITMQKAGIDNVIDLAKEMGITSPLKKEITTAIGSSEVRMIDHAVGYSVFASGGVKHPAVSIVEIKDRNGSSIDKPKSPEAKRVLSPQEAYLITHILKDYSANWRMGWNRPMAGKSGTTNDFHDAWMMAYSPNIVVGSWVGHTGPGDQNMKGIYGTEVGSTIVRDFINNGLPQANIPAVNFQRPDGLIDAPACHDATGGVGSDKELYLPGTEKECPTPTPTPSEAPLPSILPVPSICVIVGPTPQPKPSASPAPTASPGASPAPTPAPTPQPTPSCLAPG